MTVVVIATLHNHEASDPSKTNGWRIGRYAFFLIAAGGTFVYERFPGVIAQLLDYFGRLPTWSAPNNVIVNQVFVFHVLVELSENTACSLRFQASHPEHRPWPGSNSTFQNIIHSSICFSMKI